LYDSQCPGYSVAYQEKLQNDACKANSQSSPICPGYTAPTAGFSVTTVASAPVISTLVDPVTTVIEVPMVDDPIVNQTLSNNNTISLPDITKENTAIASPALGTGLRIPGLFVQSQTTTTTARQQALTNARIAARSTDNQVLNQIRDRQTQQQADTISAMSTVPGFDSYLNTEISDAQFYQPRDIYRGVNIPDNTRAKRALNQRSDRLHQEIINEQYRR
jgi:hypothetical protein